MRRHLVAPILAATLLVAAVACGGGGGGSKGSTSNGASGAEIVPASVPVFISIDSDTSSDQWKKLDDLSKKFPDRNKALDSIQASMQKDGVSWEKDVKPALGKEVDVAFLDVLNGGNDVVVITKPKDEQKLNAALDKGTSAPKHEDIGGWTVYANTQEVLDRFKRVSAKGKHLSDDSSFTDATSSQPDQAAAKLYVRGSALQDAIAQSSAGVSSTFNPGSLTSLGGKVDWIAGSATAESNGVKLQIEEKGNQKLATYTPSLTGDLPAGALLVVSFGDLSKSLKSAIDTQLKANPSYQAQLNQMEQALGFSIENDILPLISKEGAVAVYEGATPGATPTFVLALKVDNEQNATKLFDRLGALSALGGGGGTGATPVTIGGVAAKKLALGKYSIFYAAFDGKLVVTNAESGISGIHASGQKLSDDPLFKEAQSQAGGSGDTTGFVYANLENGLTVAYDAAAASSGGLGANEQEVRANSKPLRALYVGSTKDGDQFKLSGFLTIK